MDDGGYIERLLLADKAVEIVEQDAPGSAVSPCHALELYKRVVGYYGLHALPHGVIAANIQWVVVSNSSGLVHSVVKCPLYIECISYDGFVSIGL